MTRESFTSENQSYMKLSLPEPLVAGFSTRNGGVSAKPYESLNLGFHVGDDAERVLENRKKLAKDVGFPIGQWVCAEQVHGSHIRRVTRGDAGRGAEQLESAIPGTDGLYTREAGVLLALGYADCVPLYFFAPGHRIAGIAHAGWRGTTGNIAGRMIDQWVNEEKIPRQDIRVVVGPSIGACCYEVDQRVMDEVKKALGAEYVQVSRETHEGHFRLDLKECNRKLCEKAGIPADHIECSSYCTGCHSELFFSHRKENGRTGRLLGWVGIKARKVKW